MTIDDYKKATPIIEKLDNLVRAKEELEMAEEKVLQENTNRAGSGDYWSSVSEHKDGSGWKIDLTGCYLSSKLLSVLRELLNSEIREHEEKLNQIGAGIKQFKPQ